MCPLHAGVFVSMIRPLRTAVIVLISALGIAACPVRGSCSGLEGSERVRVSVVEVFDGDTIVVSQGARKTVVRLIGVDTPETSRPEHPVEFYGPEASEFTRSTLLGTRVQLEFEAPDRPGGATDKYGRTLAYVITGEGKNFSLELIRLGYGRVYAKFPFRYQRKFEQAEMSARTAGLGLWDRNKRAAWSDPARRGRIVGNIRSHIYHLPDQSGHDKVREKNRVYFQTEEDAQRAGFRKARN